MLHFTELERRDAPAIWTDDTGSYETNHQWGTVFADYHGPLNSAAVELPGQLAHYTLAMAPAAGGGPRLRVGTVDTEQQPGGQYPLQGGFDGFAFEPAFRGGVAVALGDVTGDGIPDAVVGAGAGGGPRVRVFDGATFATVADFFAYAPDFAGGITVAVLDGKIVTGPGTGGGPHVRLFDLHGTPVGGFFAGDPADRRGALVATGDVLDFDGRPEIVTLASSSTRHDLSVYSPAGDRLAGFPVLAGIVGPATVGVGYLGTSLVPHPIVAAGGILESWDSHPLFPEGRRVKWHDFNVAYARPTDIRAGTMRQLDGLARFAESGSTLGEQRFTTLDARWPLTEPEAIPLGGAAIGPVGHRQTGTLTGYLRDVDGTIYGLTNRHVPDTGGPVVGTAVQQPGGGFAPGGAGKVIGEVTRATVPSSDQPNDADAAIFRLADQTAFDPRHGYTRPDGTLGTVQTHGFGTAAPGTLVYHYGFWGVTLGLVVATGQTVTIEDGTHRYVYRGQTEVAAADAGSGWIQPGDSGSLVTDQHGRRVGQVFAGSSTIGIFPPLATVFAALGFGGSFAD